jgi:hypothetical protein
VEVGQVVDTIVLREEEMTVHKIQVEVAVVHGEVVGNSVASEAQA